VLELRDLGHELPVVRDEGSFRRELARHQSFAE
jgi:hypothetical protein